MQIGKKKIKEKRDKREMRKNEEWKRLGREKERERQRGLDILKNYRVTMKIRNRKAKENIVRKMQSIEK